MTVAGNFSADIEIVEYAELQRELVFVRRDVGAVHCEGGVAIADLLFAEFQIAENLIVSAIFLDDIDDVLDGILAGNKSDDSRILMEQVVVLNGARKIFEFAESRGNVQTRDGATQQRGNVGMRVMTAFVGSLAHAFIRAGTKAFGGGDEEIIALNRERAGIPVRRDKTESGRCLRATSGRVRRPAARAQVRGVENCYRIGRSIARKKFFSVCRLRQRAGISSCEALVANCGIKLGHDAAGFG